MIPNEQERLAVWDAAQAKVIANVFRTLNAIEAKARAIDPGGYDPAQAARDRITHAVQIYCAYVMESNG